MKFEVFSSRHDIERHRIDSFEADSDEDVKERFKGQKSDPQHDWNTLELVQVVQERKERVVDHKF